MSEFVEVKTAELVGAALDLAIAQIEKPSNLICLNSFNGGPRTRGNLPHYSTIWTHGGPLLDKFDIALNGGFADGYFDRRVIYATLRDGARGDYGQKALATGPTRLIAACRAVVRYKLGDVVQVPSVLVGVDA